MRTHAGRARAACIRTILATAGLVLLALSAVVGALTAARLQAQARAPTGQSATQSATATVPQWQIDAGGHAKFDVASVKQNKTGANATSNVPLDPEDLFTPTGGLLSASGFSLSRYMLFAYKLTAAQYFPLQSQLPKWANMDSYDIEARASGNPTKDQFRLMMADSARRPLQAGDPFRGKAASSHGARAGQTREVRSESAGTIGTRRLFPRRSGPRTGANG
jgi:Protein of unknown function (DUF3738)